MDIEKQKNELKNIDLGAMKVVRTKMHPQSKELLTLCNSRLAEAMKCKLNKDLAEFNLYAYPLMQNHSIASCFIIFNVVCVLLDDHLDTFSEGEKNSSSSVVNI